MGGGRGTVGHQAHIKDFNNNNKINGKNYRSFHVRSKNAPIDLKARHFYIHNDFF